MLTADGVSRLANRKRLVDRVSVRFESGRLNLILGANGAGKSTLLKLLSGQVRPDEGSVRYGSADARDLGLPALSRIRAVLSQSVDLAFSLRVREVVMMGRYPHFTGRPAADDERACDEVMDLFDVSGFARRDYLTLSGGEQQRVHFARVLAQIWYPVAGQCRYLFLDEPLASLDIFYQVEFMRKLQELRQLSDLVIVGVVHDLNLAARFGDALVLLREGRVLAAGPKEAVLTRENIQAAFRLAPTLVRDDKGQRTIFVFE